MMKTISILGLAFLIAVPALALAKDRQPPKSDLPGVDGDYRIVREAPPEPDAPVADADGFVTIGKTRVRVSGLVRYDVDYVGRNKK